MLGSVRGCLPPDRRKAVRRRERLSTCGSPPLAARPASLARPANGGADTLLPSLAGYASQMRCAASRPLPSAVAPHARALRAGVARAHWLHSPLTGYPLDIAA